MNYGRGQGVEHRAQGMGLRVLITTEITESVIVRLRD